MSMESRYYSGLDLGQIQDYSALAVMERTEQPHPGNARKKLHQFSMQHMHRWLLGSASRRLY